MAQNYQDIRDYLALRLGFTGNSMSAHYDREGNYIVLSYATEIARVQPNGATVINERKYSVTTSRHQNLVRNNLGA